jgi:hypothetical protein
MEINFNQLRLQSAIALDKIIQQLNAGKLQKTENVLQDNEDIEEWIEGDVLVDSKKIKENIDELRGLILTLGSCYNDEDVQDISKEIEKNGGIAKFNQAEED